MKCNECGRQSHSESPNFCEYCGSSFREKDQFFRHSDNIIQQPQNYGNNQGIDQGSRQIINQGIDQDNNERTISFFQWIKMYAILFLPSFIPFVGWVVPLVMLFVWGFANNTQPTKKNWSRATLVFLFVNIIVVAFAFVQFLGNPIFQQILSNPIAIP
ncbi:MAG TPA: hypothetical protein GXZ21_03630 [Clostridiales bacterium]|nr:hypothetical protein [Clostridiales bacterium]